MYNFNICTYLFSCKISLSLCKHFISPHKFPDLCRHVNGSEQRAITKHQIILQQAYTHKDTLMHTHLS